MVRQKEFDDTRELVASARTWLAEDPDPETRGELETLLAGHDRGEAEATAELSDRFAGTLRFGTAGLRGALGAGPNRMNRAVVMRTAAGLAAYLKRTHSGHPPEAPVVIGYDARHRSAEFARDTAAVLVGAGLRAMVLPTPLPTPVLAFAVRHLEASAGVQVTASHNPAQDNGYKVYLGNGLQVVPPIDTEIATEVDRVGPLTDLPRPDQGWDVLDAEGPGSVVEAYLARTEQVLDPHTSRDLSVVYTPMHGVGAAVLNAAFTRNGFPEPTVVPEQAEPDPDFPTLPFPNPEERGSMDLAFQCAERTGPDLVLANDPDADRCAVAAPDPDTPSGWRMLRGDDVGALLATRLVHEHAHGTFATTMVSSELLSRITAQAGLPYDETLTGFKWLSRVPRLRFGYEEALGYCVDPQAVLDKDGITAALLVAELAAQLKASGRTLWDLLDDLTVEYGVHATDQLSVRVQDLSLINQAMGRLRQSPPTTLAGLPVLRVEDLADGTANLPPSEGLRYTVTGTGGSGTGGGATSRVRNVRVVIRPSGTEPKLKCYLEAVVPVGHANELSSARELAAHVLSTTKQELAAAAGL